jgi:hypothetical protein
MTLLAERSAELVIQNKVCSIQNSGTYLYPIFTFWLIPRQPQKMQKIFMERKQYAQVLILMLVRGKTNIQVRLPTEAVVTAMNVYTWLRVSELTVVEITEEAYSVEPITST